MTMHDLRIARSGGLPSRAPRLGFRPLSTLDLGHWAKRLVVFTPTGDAIEPLVQRAKSDIQGLTGSSVVYPVISHNPDSLWAIARKDHYDAAHPRGEGFIAFLMLNEEGLGRLAAGTFDAGDPDLTLLAKQNEKPAGIYVWALHARGPLAAGVSLVFDKISTPLYADVDLYARAATDDGRRFLETLGFTRGAPIGGILATHLHVFRRSVNAGVETSPIYDDYRAGRGRDLSVTIARSLDDIMRVATIRSAVYIAEQECPYDEEFDGNDFCATHLIGYVGNEPAGCLRIRYFANFVKMERLAIRREFRRTRLAFKLVRAGIELCRAKGYRKIYGHSQKRLLNFWSRFGFKPMEGGREFVFSDFDYVEVTLDMSPHPQAVAIGVDPYVTIRPEGRWHVPGILERSAIRPATRPSAQRRRA